MNRQALLFYVIGALFAALFAAIAVRSCSRAWRRGLIQKELRHYFYSPIAWLTMAGFAFVNGFFFLFLFEIYAGRPNVPLVQVFFGGSFFWVLQLILVPAITMRLFSEERADGTLETLLTAPVRESEIVFGKFVGALVFYMSLWWPTLVLLAAALYYAAPPGFWAKLWGQAAFRPAFVAEAIGRINAVMDLGPVVTSYLGTALLGAAWIAIGLLASALSRNQIVAFVLGFVALLCSYAVGQLEALVRVDPSWFPGLRDTLRFVSFPLAYGGFPRGVIDTRAVIYFLSVAGLGLFLAVRVLEQERWR